MGNMRELLVGVDIGGTKTAVLLTTRDGQVLSETVVPTLSQSPEQSGIQCLSCSCHFAQWSWGTVSDVAAIGAGVPGLVERDAGIVRMAANLQPGTLSTGRYSFGRIPYPVLIENDVRAATVGIYHHLNQTEPLRHLAYLSVGTRDFRRHGPQWSTVSRYQRHGRRNWPRCR